MHLQVMLIRDTAAGVYGQPYFAVSTGMAVRSFSDSVNRNENNNVFYAHPDDFILFHVGTYDDATGRIAMFDDFVQLARGTDVKVR